MPVHRFNGVEPRIAEDAFVAPGAQIIGDVELHDGASVWYNCVLRADVQTIVVGARSNIQDGSVVHVTRKTHGTFIGEDCLIGHMAMIHGCTLQDHSFVGLGAIVMDACVIETDAMLAAGAMLTPGKVIPSGELWAGRPAKFFSKMTSAQIERNRAGAAGYVDLAQMHRAEAGD
ncbi:gamma carbonic anhydrase family protein [Pacificimonas sp. WHA3]|uniref:Gamma carbonic anhydrase family protein n=1 Tax=Pacificimonas pallii TaxID=2827236 RepID=A0ABS6SFV1_9SPHN|nr:gamma carbonic anhydrase family protein [Pacificimonas pallii]MBV7256786.1 gamma carbonic anhydrase family protein [Pacificimonas pallii]